MLSSLIVFSQPLLTYTLTVPTPLQDPQQGPRCRVPALANEAGRPIILSVLIYQMCQKYYFHFNPDQLY